MLAIRQIHSTNDEEWVKQATPIRTTGAKPDCLSEPSLCRLISEKERA
ncbi:MAG: hypothetical protein IPK92_02995 [Nitrospira sp.]|nr:hypothetical protein [Nitrospira sp.]